MTNRDGDQDGGQLFRPRVGRRGFLKDLAVTAGAASAFAAAHASGRAEASGTSTFAQPASKPRLRFAVIGINHDHINSMVPTVIRGGGELVWLFAKEPDLVKGFQTRFPQAKLARSEDEILQDPSIQLVLSSIVPVERAPLGIRVMQHGKDYMCDKPGIATLPQLAEAKRVQAETKRIYSISYSERFENKATVRAGELVKAGAIGHVIQTVGLGPHRMNAPTRPAWFFDKANYGGILVDIASHQADQFLFFTGSDAAEVVSSQVGNVHYAERYPNFEDFGDMMIRGNRGSGYIRCDWFTPDGLSTWGDTRLTIIGTDGYIEVRKNVDIAGRSGANHLFLVDKKETRYVDSSDVTLPYGIHLVDDVLNRTETAMPQSHCFLAMELVLTAQAKAQRLTLRV
jgi:predicted dehydrogenase